MKHEKPPPVHVSRETRERLDILASDIGRWSAVLNLVGRDDLARLEQRHVADSLQILSLLPPDVGNSIDLGSGGGFPGLVLAIASGRRFHLIEADRRKAAFLREAGRRCQADIVVHDERIEACSLPRATLITARALAPLNQLLRWSAPILDPRGICLFLKGHQVERELTQAAREWHMKVRRWQSRTRSDAIILEINEIAPHAGYEP